MPVIRESDFYLEKIKQSGTLPKYKNGFLKNCYIAKIM